MTDYVVILLPVILPVVFWAAYHLHVDRYLPEPPGQLLLAFALGVGSFWLGLLGYRALGLVGLRYDAFALGADHLPGLFAYAILAIGVIEESAKLLPFLLVIRFFREFDEPIDGIIYASFIALGFAAVENIRYLDYLDTRQAYARGFVGPVLHIVFASIWGYHVGRAWLRRRAVVPTLFAALGFSALVHGVYNFVVIGLPAPGLPIAAGLIAGLWIWRLRLIRDLHAAYLQDQPKEPPG
ncbi:MAG: PrsW family intramembrane metalloprotease [Xanthomonadales bacterium]|jgi:RsiW-degrading membrane proteinase PrsW (M82 family)|nr:PrsW family intramembrane metalloprotease [Xanthomonadales bacterium]